MLLPDDLEVDDLKLKIEFGRSDAVYSPSDNLDGSVLILSKKATVCRAISVKVEGRCSVRWSEEKKRKNMMGRKETYIEDFTAVETYFERTFYLVKSTDDVEMRKLPEGETVFCFSFTLPPNIPCSFQHKNGSINYFVTATLINMSESGNFVETGKFRVLAPYNLNQMPRAAIGIDDQEYQNFSCFCIFKLGSLHVRVKTPVTGFTPGQTIEVNVSFYNDSASVDVRKVKIALEQIYKFQATRPRNVIKCERSIIGKDKKSESFGDKNEVILFIKVPQVLPSNLVNCSLIEIQYRLRVKIITSGMHFNIEKSYPLLIGTVPLYLTSATVVPFVHVPRTPSVTPTAPSLDVLVPVPRFRDSSNLSPSSRNDSSVNQSYTQEYQPIGFVSMEHSSYVQNSPFAMQPETPPPSYEECTSDTQNSISVPAN